MQHIIGFIGGGNMAASLIGGLIKSGHPATHIRVAEPFAARAEWLHKEFGVTVKSSATEIVSGAQVLVLAVKPQMMSVALAGLTPDAGCTVITIAAGVRLATLQRQLGDAVSYVRTMPNTPSLYGCGITGLYAPQGTPPAARELANKILATAGETVWLQREEDLDAVTAVSGSGPAYFFLVIEAMRDAGIALGLAPEVASKLAAQTCVGAARMAAEGADVVQLRANVTSKGGTTEAAVQSLESAGLRAIFNDALTQAALRARELGDALDASA